MAGRLPISDDPYQDYDQGANSTIEINEFGTEFEAQPPRDYDEEDEDDGEVDDEDDDEDDTVPELHTEFS
jgi:hypothetical protein